jgi:6-phosphofructokinase 1
MILKTDFTIEKIGEASNDSSLTNIIFEDDAKSIVYSINPDLLTEEIKNFGKPLLMEKAGPRKKIFFRPSDVRAAILTAGGLCPGLNDVIKGVVNTLCLSYGTAPVKGIRYGYRGIIEHVEFPPLILDPDVVDDIHIEGGTILGSSRGHQKIGAMIDAIVSMGINILFCVGGDGTLRGAKLLGEEIMRRKLDISIVGIPKTIDNDISFTERSFGFETAVSATDAIINSAHSEAKGAYNGVGLVKLMGRESGFITAHATIANSVVNYCFVPELPLVLEGDDGFLPHLMKRLERKQHAVVLVAEGAGQELFATEKKTDRSGNLRLNDIGLFLKNKIEDFAKRESFEVNVKYFDPSYVIRSGDAIGSDAVFCMMLAQNAVHAGMAGRTSLMIGYHNGEFVHVPLSLAVATRKKLDINGAIWRSVVELTSQNKP